MEYNKKQGMIPALTSLILISILVITVGSFLIYNQRIIGPILLLLGLVPLLPIKISGRTFKSTGADIIFGVLDTGILVVAALIGASFAGILGAIVGGAIGDSITDGFAGLIEGNIANYLRKHGIEEARTPLSASMGKMSGCLMGVGFTLTVAWTLFNYTI